MKRVLVLFLVLSCAVCGIAQAQNAVQNPGFETVDTLLTDAADWNEFRSPGSVSQRITTMPRSGQAHMELIVDGANNFAGVFQNLNRAVAPGAFVTFTGFNRSLDQPFAATRELKLEWQGMPNPPQTRVVSLGPIGSDYEQFTISGVAPAGTTGLVVTYAVSTFGANQNLAWMFIDDFDVRIFPVFSGDYNENSIVDAADYTVWRDALTAGSTTLPNDPTPGAVDESDFLYWRAHFGESFGSGAGAGAAAAVPEPASMVMLIVAAICIRLRRRQIA